MELAVSTGIFEEFPCASTGKIVGSNGYKDILALKHPIPGSEGFAPDPVSAAYISVIITSVHKRPVFYSKRFEDRNRELYLIVDIPDAESEYYKSKRWKARLILRAGGPDGHHRIDRVIDVPAFWLQELQEGQVV
jgi:hypothetical protein